MKNFIFVSPHFPDNYWKFCIALKERGFNVLGIGDAPYNEIKDECKFALQEYYLCSFMDNFENEKRAVQYFRDKYGPIDFIESNNEYWLPKDALLRDIFDVHTSFTKEEIDYRMKKSNQKEFYKRAGVNPARFVVTHDVEEVKKFAEEVGYPIFSKPNVGVGAQNTCKIHNEVELVNFVTSIPQDIDYIFEEFIEGDLISFDGIADADSNVVFATSHEFYNNTASVVESRIDNMYCCLPECPRDLLEIGKRCIKEFGLRQRFFHFEFFRLTKDQGVGKKGDIVPLEANLRPAGAYTPDLINFANSVNCYEIYADVIAYNENRQKMDYEKYFACSVCFRNKYHYRHSLTEIVEKYRNNICCYGDFPNALRDDMGDYYVIGKFKTREEMVEFDRFAREKDE